MLNLDYKKILTSHSFFWISILGGMICGIFFKNLGVKFEPFAQMYISFLQLSVIPVIIITVTIGLAHITSHTHARDKIWRIFSSLFILLIISSVLSTLIGWFLSPGVGLSKNPEISALITASDHAFGSAITTKDPIIADVTPSLLKFLLGIVPRNIFESLSKGAVLQIILFAIIFGAAIGYQKNRDGVDRSSFFQMYLPIFTRINDAVIFFLPFGIFFLLSSQFATFSLSTVLILTKLVFAICSSMILISLIFVAIIWYYSKRSLKSVLSMLGYITLMAFSTRSAFACIPKCIEKMSEIFDQDTARLVIPFGNTTCRFGSICFYTIGTIFISDIFVTSISFYGYITIIFSAILASFAASGAVGIVSLQLITIVLDPLGLPLGTVLALFIAIDPIVDIFDTIANVFGNCAATAISSGRPKSHKHVA